MIQSGCVPTRHSKTQVHLKCFRAEYGVALPISKVVQSWTTDCILTTCSVNMLHISQTGDSADLGSLLFIEEMQANAI